MARSVVAVVLAGLVALTGCVGETERDPLPPEEPDAPPMPAPRPIEWGDPAAAAVYPGAPIGGCTYNFLFVDPDGEADNGTPTYYIGTAAHCTDDVGERLQLAGEGEIGTVVFDSDNETFHEEFGVEEAVDFALVRLDDGVNRDAHPRMKNTQGPTGIATGADVALGDELRHHGYGMVFGEVEPLRDRPGWVVSYDRSYCSQSVVWFGDSGSPVLHAATGYAFGIVNRAGWFECEPASQLAGATLPYILDELAKTPLADVRLALEDGSVANATYG